MNYSSNAYMKKKFYNYVFLICFIPDKLYLLHFQNVLQGIIYVFLRFIEKTKCLQIAEKR